MATCLGSDSDNVFVTLSARGLAPALKIIARAEDSKSEGKLKRAGADRVICPPLLSAARVSRMMIQPNVDELLELAVTGNDLEVSKFHMAQLARAAGKTLRQMELPRLTGLMVVAIIHPDGSRQFNPSPDFQPHPDDHLIVIGPQGSSQKLTALYGHAEPPVGEKG